MQEGGKNYAGVIRNRRKQAGLSQEELAELDRLLDIVYRNIEDGD